MSWLMWCRAWEERVVGRRSEMRALADAADKNVGARGRLVAADRVWIGTGKLGMAH